MKLRIQGNSLRLRVSRSELARFLAVGSLEDRICFGTEPGEELVYTLRRDEGIHEVRVESRASKITVALPAHTARSWVETEQVGIAAEIDLGECGTLSVLIEKDFACIDRSAEENADTFPNPLLAQAC